MGTEPKYLDDTYCFEFEATITDISQKGTSADVYFDETIFYPQGGGQPSDVGYIEIDGTRFNVTSVGYQDNNIVHHVMGLEVSDNLVGRKVKLYIDGDKRITHAKSHTGGHLITHILETMNSEFLPAKGHHFPGESYVELLDEKRLGNGELLDEANRCLHSCIAESADIVAASANFEEIEKVRPFLARYVPKDKPTRMLTIGKFTPVPCGGTHVKNTNELNGLVITRIKRKKDRLKVSYEFK